MMFSQMFSGLLLLAGAATGQTASKSEGPTYNWCFKSGPFVTKVFLSEQKNSFELFDAALEKVLGYPVNADGVRCRSFPSAETANADRDKWITLVRSRGRPIAEVDVLAGTAAELH
ncbi:MAG TPA: hypothetical protein VGD10_04580 [Allosphingosinicella sp.]|uniref:hypothetical protein n=1 Tax=Allosphingosinicella sp. TaxID=2823234 RepID=UPI002ED8C124